MENFPKNLNSDNNEKRKEFEKEISEHIDMLLEATDLESVLSNIKKCEETTDNDLLMCYKDTLMAIRLSLNLIVRACEKYNKEHHSFSDELYEKYKLLNSFTDEIDDDSKIEDINSLISKPLSEMNDLALGLKEKLLKKST